METQDQSTELKVEKLNQMFTDGEGADRATFADMRTAILLYKGDHFKKNSKAFLDRNSTQLTSDTKMKLSENHVGIVCDRTKSAIVNQAPGVLFTPNNANERGDIKDAELCNSVKESAEEGLKYYDKLDRWVDSFVVQGECFSLNYFDPFAGEVRGYKQKTNAAGEPLFVHPSLGEIPMPIDEFGQPLPLAQGDEPVFRGELKKEVIEPYNVIRPKSATSLDESPWLCIRKMLSQEDAKALIKNSPDYEDLLSEIKTASDTTYQVFENNEYVDISGQVLVKYWFFRKCVKYPKGYFIVQVNNKKASEGELPFGVWPIAHTGFKTTSGSPRATGKVKDIRHAQTHLNFLVSNEAFHMVALGDDKVFTQMGTKLTMGATWNGIRSFSVNGPAPVVQQGRDASQFARAIDRQVMTIYRLGDVEYETQETKMQDPFAMLYSSLKNKLKHSPYASKFERFLCDDWKIYIELSKHYLDDDAIIKHVGKREAINIPEFKAVDGKGYRIKAKPVSGTLEEQLGQSLQVQQILQYVGKDLPKTVVARLINLMPFVSKEAVASEMLLTDKNIENDILAMDRSEFRPAVKDDDHAMYMQRLKSHMKSSEFRTLNPEVQNMYQIKYKQHEDFSAQLVAEQQRAEQGIIPTGGGMVKFDLLDENGKRMVADVSSVQWFLKQLAAQGATQEALSQQDQQTQINILNQAQNLVNNQQQQQGMMPPQAPMMPPIA
jgi:hypothetical protein